MYVIKTYKTFLVFNANTNLKLQANFKAVDLLSMRKKTFYILEKRNSARLLQTLNHCLFPLITLKSLLMLVWYIDLLIETQKRLYLN